MSERSVVLVCESERPRRDAFTGVLREAAFAVYAVADGVECLKWLGRSRCDVILMSTMLPRLGGIDCLKRIRQASPPDALPVILVGAEATTDDGADAFAAGANDFVAAPVHLPELATRTRHLIRTRDAVAARVEIERQRAIIETLGRSTARLADPIARMVDSLEQIAAQAAQPTPPERHDTAGDGRLERILSIVDEVVDLLERLQSAGRDADLPASERLDLLRRNDAARVDRSGR